MIISLYKEAIHLQFTEEEGNHLFKDADEGYVKVAGSLNEGLIIIGVSLDRYLQNRSRGGRYFKVQTQNWSNTRKGYIPVTWNFMQLYTIRQATGGYGVETSLTSINGSPALKLQPISDSYFTKENIVTTPRQYHSTRGRLSGKTIQNISPPPPSAPVKPQFSLAPVATTSESTGDEKLITELKGLALLLNNLLSDNPNLYASIKDNQIILIEEYETLEEI